jgi:hypothetical protein
MEDSLLCSSLFIFSSHRCRDKRAEKVHPQPCPRFFAFLPPHSMSPSMIHGPIRNKLNQQTNSEDPVATRQNNTMRLCTSGSGNRSNSVRTGKILACLVLCRTRTAEWLLPSSTVSRKPTILVELLFMLLDLSPAIDTRTEAMLKQHKYTATELSPHDLFLRQKFAILIRFELYFDK